MGSQTRMAAAIERIKAWMVAHKAPLLAENLAPAANAELLTEAEAVLGFKLPADLRALWLLHNGQKEEMNGFMGRRDFLDVERALAEVDTVRMSVEFLREEPTAWREAGVRPDEVESSHWVPFAGRDSELLVVSGVSGRVFSCEADSPPLRFLASSVAEWLDAYAKSVEENDYSVELGFGDYYLAFRSREAEAAEEAWERRAEQTKRYKRETPLIAQLTDALYKGDGAACAAVFERAGKKRVLPQMVEVLFENEPKPELAAAALQFVLKSVTLTAEQWSIVAQGAKAISNHALYDYASARAKTA